MSPFSTRRGRPSFLRPLAGCHAVRLATIGSAALAVLVLSAGFAAVGSARTGDESSRSSTNPRGYVLLPYDLAPGYEYGDDSACGTPTAGEGNWPTLESFFATERPQSCTVEIQWAWKGAPSYARSVTSAAYLFRSVDAARRAFVARDELVAFTTSFDVRSRQSITLGDEAELIRGPGLNARATGVVWRVGKIVAVLSTEPAVSTKAARRLAAMQQARLEHPAHPTRAQLTNDLELRLDDPRLTVPVYWLGASYDPPGSLPRIGLRSVQTEAPWPGPNVQLWYSGINLDTMLAGGWNQYRRTTLGRLVWDSPCARKTVVETQFGQAEIFEGYGEPAPVMPPCPARPPDRVIAHVHAGNVVIVVNMPYCYTCAHARTPRNPYETVTAMTTVVQSLQLRARRR